MRAWRGKVDYFSSKHLRKGLKDRTVSGALHSAAGQIAILLTNLAAIPVLTRLLEPAAFGVVAMAVVFTGLAALFVDSGLTMATVQRDDLSHDQASALFWVSAAIGLLIAVLVGLAAPVVAWVYGEPEVYGITLGLAIAPLFSGLTIQHQALLRRAMQMRALAIVQVSACVLANAVAVVVAWRYRTYWALVILPVAMAAFRMLGTWAMCPWRPSLPRRGADVRTMVGFGANLTGFHFVNYFARSGDNMLIGWFWGGVALGYYERAYKLMMAPLEKINSPLGGIMIPALSRLNDEPEVYRATYLRSVAVLQVVSGPLMVFVAVMSPLIVGVVFGSGYEEAGPILRALAVAGFFQPLMNSFGWLYVSQGRGRQLMRWGLMNSALVIASFLVGLPWGPLGVARAYAAMVCLVAAPLAMMKAGSAGPVRAADLAHASLTALLMAAPTALASLSALWLSSSGPPFVTLLLGAGMSVIATFPILYLTKYGQWLLAQLRDLKNLALRSARVSPGGPRQA